MASLFHFFEEVFVDNKKVLYLRVLRGKQLIFLFCVMIQFKMEKKCTLLDTLKYSPAFSVVLNCK